MDIRSVIARLWAKSHVDPDSGCWIWDGLVDRKGYGKISVQRRTLAVHRLAKLLIGTPFDPDLSLDHLCRNTRCWNPAHLDPCPIAENILRGASPPADNARKTHCVNGHELTDDNVRRRPGPRSHHRECLTCHRAYSNIKHRRNAA